MEFKNSLRIFESFKIKHSVNGYFGLCYFHFENDKCVFELWNTAYSGFRVFQLFKHAAGMIEYKPVNKNPNKYKTKT